MATTRSPARAVAESHTAARKHFSPAKSEKWVLTSAVITGLVYLVRRLVEGETAGTTPAPKSAARAFLGQGTPPSFGQWIIAYTTSYFFLALLTVAVPEVAASLAIFVLVATFLESGGQLASDLQQIESGTAPAAATPSNVSTLGPSGTANPYTSPLPAGQTVPASFGPPTASSLFSFPSSPQSVGAGVAASGAATRAQITALNAKILSEKLPPGYSAKVVNGVAEILHNGTVVDKG